MTRSVVLAVAQAFKGSLTLGEVRRALEEGIARAGGDPVVLPGSDGGDGLLEALDREIVRRDTFRVTGPLGDPVEAEIAWLDDTTAVIESRQACGLSLLEPAQRDPTRTTTRGVGDLISQACERGAETVYVGLGGSATMDGGLGMATAWGWTLNEGTLSAGRTPVARIVGLCDVQSPLLGPHGAARFARQKGATDAQSGELVARLEHLVAFTAGHALAGRPGAGAAGGLGFGILCFADGELVEGAAWVLDRVGFDEALGRAALVLTGEGAFDATSLAGKLTGEVLRRAAERHVPAALVAPSAADVPANVVVETGTGRWSAEDLMRHTELAVRRALRLPEP